MDALTSTSVALLLLTKPAAGGVWGKGLCGVGGEGEVSVERVWSSGGRDGLINQSRINNSRGSVVGDVVILESKRKREMREGPRWLCQCGVGEKEAR